MVSARTPFLAVHALPAGASSSALSDAFERVAEEAERLGIRAVVSFFSPHRNRAYTFFEDHDEETVRRTCERAGLTVLDVLHGERLADEIRDG